MQNGMSYVFYDSNTLFAYGMPCDNSGDTVTLHPTVARGTYYRILGGKLYKIREGYYVSNGDDEYIVHCWTDGGSLYFLDYNAMLLPACLFVIVFFSCIWHWFLRLRG